MRYWNCRGYHWGLVLCRLNLTAWCRCLLKVRLLLNHLIFKHRMFFYNWLMTFLRQLSVCLLLVSYSLANWSPLSIAIANGAFDGIVATEVAFKCKKVRSCSPLQRVTIFAYEGVCAASGYVQHRIGISIFPSRIRSILQLQSLTTFTVLAIFLGRLANRLGLFSSIWDWIGGRRAPLPLGLASFLRSGARLARRRIIKRQVVNPTRYWVLWQ